MAEINSQGSPSTNTRPEKEREVAKNASQLTKEAAQNAARNAARNEAKTAKETERFEEKSLQQKTVTVIMPIRNEAGFIRESLAAVLNQDYPADLIEILVVDGMSTDETCAIVSEIQSKHHNIRLLENPGKVVPIGLNIALAQTRGEIFVRVDGHCVIQPDYIRRCVEYLEIENVDGVGGPMETIGETPSSQAIALAMSSPFGVGGSAFRTVKDRRMFVDTVAFPAYKRETIRKVGPFDEELVRNQDDEYNFRLREMGGRILMTPDIRSRYYSRSSISGLWRQYFQYGYWKVRVMQKHPRQMSLRQFIPPAFVVSLVVLALLATISAPARILLAGIVGAYLIANLSAAVLTASRGGWRYLGYLPAAFATLHISYGAGFLYGLAKFANCWRAEAHHG
jgi:succinoglycan biosynthesis protein ExoA